MRVTVKVDTFALRRKIDDVAKIARTAATEQALQDVYALVPYETHVLANSAMSHSNPEEGRMTWATPYAKVRYYKGTPKHPQTTTHWVEKAAERYSDDWIAAAERAVRK